MSTGAECHFDEVSPGRWTYWLQSWPYGDNPDGETYGPFPSFARASKHLDENHANPGGYSVNALPDGQHVHEWTTGEGWGPIGMIVEVRVKSLGPTPTREAVIDLIKALPADSPAWSMHSWTGIVQNQTRCEACGKVTS